MTSLLSYQIRLLNEELRRHLDAPEHRAFRSERGKMMFSSAMRNAFGTCVSNIVAVPVTDVPDDSMPRYVLEVDIIPHSAICDDLVFSYMEDRRVRTIVRMGSSSISTEGIKDFENEVRKRAEWRRQAELQIQAKDTRPLTSTDSEWEVDEVWG